MSSARELQDLLDDLGRVQRLGLPPPRLKNARSWWMTAAARRSSLAMSSSIAPNSSRSGGWRLSRCRAASALLRMAVSGWFSSCARAPDSWPSTGRARQVRELAALLYQLELRAPAGRHVRPDHHGPAVGTLERLHPQDVRLLRGWRGRTPSRSGAGRGSARW